MQLVPTSRDLAVERNGTIVWYPGVHKPVPVQESHSQWRGVWCVSQLRSEHKDMVYRVRCGPVKRLGKVRVHHQTLGSSTPCHSHATTDGSNQLYRYLFAQAC